MSSGTVSYVSPRPSSESDARVAAAELRASEHLAAAAAAAEGGRLGEFLEDLPSVRDQLAAATERRVTPKTD
jgi:hypothetical protein